VAAESALELVPSAAGWSGLRVAGALIGGAVGAGTGALTDEDQINLGKPVWR
jgi:hypothetical protein